MKTLKSNNKATILRNKQEVTSLPSYPSVPLGVIFLFCGYVIVWYLQVGIRLPAFGAIRLEMIWALMLIGIILITNNYTTKITNPLTNYILLFLLSMIVSIPLSCNIAVSWDIFFNRVIKFSFMGIFIACFVKKPRDLRLFLGSFLLACGKMVQEGVHGQLTGSLVWQNQGVMRLHGPTPLYFHPNSFCGMALGVIPFVLSLWELVNKYIKVLLLLLMVCSFAVVLFTGSRTGYIAFLFMLGIVFLRNEKKINSILVGAILLAISVMYVPEQYKDRFHSSFTSHHDKNTSAGQRVEILEDAILIFLDHPFGVGVGAFPTMRQLTFNRMQDTHNLYLEVLTNIGIQGFVVFVLLVTKMLSVLRRLNKEIGIQISTLTLIIRNEAELGVSEHCHDLKLMQAVARAVFLFVCIRLGLGIFGMDLYEIYWWFALGLTIALFRMNEIAEQKTEFFLTKK